jgi:hypothetical protein
MKRYSISDLEQLSGVKAHTIRVWERRYGGLKPMRSEGNTRYYDDVQLKRLLNVVSLMAKGRKASELFSMTDSGLNALIDEQLDDSRSENPQYEYFISKMIVDGLNYNEAGFERNYSVCLVRYGLKNTYLNILYPLLMRLGLLWSKDAMTPAQEHFMSCLIKQKIISAIDGLPVPSEPKDSWMLFLPEDEYHEIGMLFAHYVIRAAGRKTIYLGASVPFDSLKQSIRDNRPDHLLFFLIRNRSVEETQQYLDDLAGNAKGVRLHVAGHERLIGQLKLKKNTDWIRSVDELNALVK